MSDFELRESLEKLAGRNICYLPDGAPAWSEPLANVGVFAELESGSSVDEETWEIRELKHGVLTYCFVEGLSERSDLEGNGEVTFLEVALYVSRRVRKLTSDALHSGCVQTPRHTLFGKDFPLIKIEKKENDVVE